MRVLVTGATGGIGSAIIDHLDDMGVRTRGCCRRPDSQSRPRVQTVSGDLEEPRSMRRALKDIDAVFLYSFAQTEALHVLVDEMQAAGVRKVVVLSTIDTTRDEPFVEFNKQWHLAVENAMEDGGFATVCLRPGAFARNAIRFWAKQIRTQRDVGLPFPESHQAPIADEDIAAVAARALTSDDLDGEKIVLSGPESLTMREQICCISQTIGEPIAVTTLSETEARGLYGQVLPPVYLDLLMAQWAFTVDNPAEVTRAVHDISGRQPTSFRQWAIDHRGAFV